MLEIQIASDLHIEYNDKNNLDIDVSKYIIPKAKVLILAGDIGHLYYYEQLYNFLFKVCKLFQYVLYIPGNHEFYYSTKDHNLPFSILSKRLDSLCDSIHNLHILNRNAVCIQDTFIIGCTLWTKTEDKIPPYAVRIRDIDKNAYNKLHETDLDYLNKMISFLSSFRKKIVVVTHHCPTFNVFANKETINKYTSLYAVDLNRLLNRDTIHTWICGHIHENFDFFEKWKP